MRATPAAAAGAALAILAAMGVTADVQVPLQPTVAKAKRGEFYPRSRGRLGASCPTYLPRPEPWLIIKELTGRFMHITDFHPDPFYKKKATYESGCHRLKGEKEPDEGRSRKGQSKARFDTVRHAITGDGDGGDGEELAGEWGAPVS